MTKKYPYKTIKGKKTRLHRHIMEEHLGRELTPNEHVYHINGNPLDNDIENLIVIVKNSASEVQKPEDQLALPL